MRRPIAIAIILIVSALPIYAGDTTAIALSVWGDGLCAHLEWDGGDDGYYTINVRYPGDDTLTTIAQNLTERQLTYCFHRQICGDTVLFTAEHHTTEGVLTGISNTIGETFDDRRPTTPCTPIAATADSEWVRITWRPSPDADIMGYYISTGKPSVGYDTVWGNTTTYVCVGHRANESHYYRVLAFDSCYRASALSDYFCNLVLTSRGDACLRSIEYTWNACEGMAGGVDHYDLRLKYDNGTTTTDNIPPTNPLSFHCVLPDDASSVTASVAAIGKSGDTAISNTTTFDADKPDTADYLQITHCEYDMEQDAVVIHIEADSLYTGQAFCTLYRANDSSMPEPLTILPYQPHMTYTDHDATVLRSSHYRYLVGVTDRCGTREKRSHEYVVTLPSMESRGVIFPNVFTPGSISNNRFCPAVRFVDNDHYSLHIYNRTGGLVFHSTSPQQCWDGTQHGVRMPQGVYTYVMRCRYKNGDMDCVTGTVLLLD